MKIGFIGLGIMGSRMAANLQKCGHSLFVFNRTREKADSLVAAGAHWAASRGRIQNSAVPLWTRVLLRSRPFVLLAGEHRRRTPQSRRSSARGGRNFPRGLFQLKAQKGCSNANVLFGG
jgi:hypothetical protein